MTEGEPEKLKRESAGSYRTADGRFTVEQTSSGWLVQDAEQANELGLPLTRGPYPTLDGARAGILDARTGATPTPLRAPKVRPAARTATGTPDGDTSDGGTRPGRRGAGSAARPARRGATRRSGPEVVIRELRAVDGEQLRRLWAEAGFRSLGDDDLSLARMARRNPGLLLVAAEGSRIVGSALGAWDGRRGWIYHVATAASHRRRGIATQLLDRVERGLRDLGCPKVSVLVRDQNEDGRAFWLGRGYEQGSTQFARELRE